MPNSPPVTGSTPPQTYPDWVRQNVLGWAQIRWPLTTVIRHVVLRGQRQMYQTACRVDLYRHTTLEESCGEGCRPCTRCMDRLADIERSLT